LDIHGFTEVLWGSTYINPHGQVLGTHGEESAVAGLNWTIWKGGGWINTITLGGLAFADFVDGPNQGVWANFGPQVWGDLFDVGGAVIARVTFWQYWTLSDQFTMVLNAHAAGTGSTVALGCGVNAGGCVGSAPLPANELRLTLSDSFVHWWGGLTFNPYVSWFYDFANFNVSSVQTNAEVQGCFTCGPNRSEFFLGIDPTLDVSKWWGVPLTFKAPTYVTVGPSNFWTGGFGFNNCPGASPGCTPSAGSWGVFTTGLTAIWGLKNWIPSNYGNWYIRGGFQYYNLINDNLVISENASVGCLDNVTQACKTNRNIWVGFVGLGVTF
jgi:hypothetical protein